MAHIPLVDDAVPAHAVRDPSSRHGRRHLSEEQATVLLFDGGPAEQVVRTQATQVVPPGGDPDGWTVLAPVTERRESIGLLEMVLPTEPEPRSIAEIARAAHLLAFVVIANRWHTDLFEWGQRTRPFTLSAWLEPAASIGGDTFDYSQDRDVLHLSLTDAMGHGVASALAASLCLGSLRNSRRRGASLLDQAATCNAEMAEYAEGVCSESYATGILGRLDLLTGELTLVNAGHVAPYLARGDDVRHLDLPRDLPLGIFADAPYRATTVALEPATGSCWSPTGCSSATPLTSASWAASARPGRCTPAR